MDVAEEKYAVKFPQINWTRIDNFHLSWLSMKAELRGERINNPSINDNVSAKIPDDALSLIMSALSDDLLRAIQNCSTAKDEWDKLQPR